MYQAAIYQDIGVPIIILVILVTGRGSLDSSMGAFMISGVLLLLVDEESPTWCFGDHDESGYKHQILTLMESQILNWRLPLADTETPPSARRL